MSDPLKSYWEFRYDQTEERAEKAEARVKELENFLHLYLCDYGECDCPNLATCDEIREHLRLGEGR